MAKKIQAPIKTPYRRNTGHKWYVYVLVTFSSLCLMLAALFVALQFAGVDPWKFIGVHKDKPGVKDDSIFKREDFNVLIAGLDGEGDQRRSDSIVLAHVSQKNNYINFVFIPRDLRVPIPGYGLQKINAAYALGGEQLMAQTLSDLFGVKIDYYYIFDTNGFVTIIDAIGGLDVYVEKNMYYTDRSQDLYIDLKKGMQHLDGRQVMHYARFRHDAEGDFGRIKRQRKLITILNKHMYEELKSGRIIEDVTNILNRITDEARKNSRFEIIETNLGFDQMLQLGKAYNAEMKKNTNSYMVPGVPQMIGGGSYVIADTTELPYMVGGALNGGYHPDNKEVKIEVLNGCRAKTIADTYARRLEYYGFDIIREDNADNFDYRSTVIKVHRDTPFAKAIGELLDAEIVSDPDPGSIADISVVIGRDKLATP